MIVKHLPHYAPDADRIVFDGDGSTWVRIDGLDATLGSGTCEIEELNALSVTLGMFDTAIWCECSECGGVVFDGKTRFCPSCGALVVDDDGVERAESDDDDAERSKRPLQFIDEGSCKVIADKVREGVRSIVTDELEARGVAAEREPEPCSNLPEPDTREKLEADARDLQSRIWDAGSRHDGISLSHIIDLLDRQAAITERESHRRIDDLSRDCEMWRDRSEDMRMERDDLARELEIAEKHEQGRDSECEQCMAGHDETIAGLARERDELQEPYNVLIRDLFDALVSESGMTRWVCEACGASGYSMPRANPRRYCCDTCRKWAARNVGGLRGMLDYEPENELEEFERRMRDLGVVE